MKITIPKFLRWHPIFSSLSASILFGTCIFFYNYFTTDDRIPVPIVGVHHLGSNYLINRFFVDGYGGSNVGRGGGGGGRLCCVTLPRKWRPGLTAEVRWEVYRFIGSDGATELETPEIDGIYKARVPVENYLRPDNFHVHFFRDGRVRIVVGEISTDEDAQTIQSGDPQPVVTVGTVTKALFTSEEIAEATREAVRNKTKYGDWR